MLKYKLDIKNHFTYCCAKKCGKIVTDGKGNCSLENDLYKLLEAQQYFLEQAIEKLNNIRGRYNEQGDENEKCYCCLTEMIFCLEIKYFSEFSRKIESYTKYVKQKNKYGQNIVDETDMLYQIKDALVDIGVMRLQ